MITFVEELVVPTVSAQLGVKLATWEVGLLRLCSSLVIRLFISVMRLSIDIIFDQVQ